MPRNDRCMTRCEGEQQYTTASNSGKAYQAGKGAGARGPCLGAIDFALAQSYLKGPQAQVAELVDALASGASARKGVEVRVFSWAPITSRDRRMSARLKRKSNEPRR